MRFLGKAVSLLFVFVAVFCIVISNSCKKAPSCAIPNVAVDFNIDTSFPQFIKLNAIGGWVYVTGGSKGIIIYCQQPGVYMAYDRNCTYMPTSANAVVQVDTTNNITATDSSCGSKFSLYDGSVLKGPASCSLKQYTTVVSGTTVHVYSQ